MTSSRASGFSSSSSETAAEGRGGALSVLDLTKPNEMPPLSAIAAIELERLSRRGHNCSVATVAMLRARPLASEPYVPRGRLHMAKLFPGQTLPPV